MARSGALNKLAGITEEGCDVLKLIRTGKIALHWG